MLVFSSWQLWLLVWFYFPNQVLIEIEFDVEDFKLIPGEYYFDFDRHLPHFFLESSNES
ncbi:hypothetical protein H1P_460035 [Hyella patelloides LEGE 07179]|uniref:Uncharacterized protein n=1 Tax=Hyella patelloides LEGE 07179 TaxID=945734 RepID=A0A563VYN9_9CYAN|nr:hypothetical protein H1P_460035 [Hyella patelloides LEGE 07179]